METVTSVSWRCHPAATRTPMGSWPAQEQCDSVASSGSTVWTECASHYAAAVGSIKLSQGWSGPQASLSALAAAFQGCLSSPLSSPTGGPSFAEEVLSYPWHTGRGTSPVLSCGTRATGFPAKNGARWREHTLGWWSIMTHSMQLACGSAASSTLCCVPFCFPLENPQVADTTNLPGDKQSLRGRRRQW